MSYGSTPPPPPPPPPPPGPPPQYGAGQSTAYGQLAQWPIRALGYVIDLALYIPAYILMIIGAPSTTTTVTSTGARIVTTSGPGALYYIGVLVIIGVFIWNRCYKGGQGQTVGRKVAGVTLINAQGQPLGTGMAFVRDLAHIVDSLICYIGWLFPLWDAKRQTLADKIVNTSVVTVPKG